MAGAFLCSKMNVILYKSGMTDASFLFLPADYFSSCKEGISHN